MPDIPLLNHPDLWVDKLVWPQSEGHKYHRGHSIILGAEHFTGATRLAAEACSRIGSGLVTVLSDTRADLYRETLPADIMVGAGPFDTLRRPGVVLAGPGGCGPAQRAQLRALPPHIPQILNAEAIASRPVAPAGTGPIVITPHEGEFTRVFPDLAGPPMARAVAAAEQTGWIIVLKGPETCLASPDGHRVINRHASPWLAKAGTGDVLAGLVTGLVAQGVAPFDAACAAVWIHGEAGCRVGPGLLPQDLFDTIRPILRDLHTLALARLEEKG